MKAVALLLLYFGYSLVVYGVDHIESNCTPFGCTLLGQFAGSQCGSGSTPCSAVGASTKAPSQPAGISGQTVPGTSLPSGGQPIPAVKGKYTTPALPGWTTLGAPPSTVTNPSPNRVFYVKPGVGA